VVVRGHGVSASRRLVAGAGLGLVLSSPPDLVPLLRHVVTAVEGVTGLTAYDQQTDAPFLGGGMDTAASVFEQVHWALANHSVTGTRPANGSSRWKRMFRR
jgi:hypothetical protein